MSLQAGERQSSSRRVSDLLEEMLRTQKADLTIAEILGAVGDRSFGFLVFLLGIPNCVPMPPPIATISALLLMLIAVQFALRREAPTLPRAVLQHSLRVTTLRSAYLRLRPVLLRLEKLSGGGQQWSSQRAHFATAGFLVALSAGLLTAVPVVGQIPWGAAVCLIGLALIEHDRILFAAALAAGAVGAFTSWATAYALAEGIRTLF